MTHQQISIEDAHEIAILQNIQIDVDMAVRNEQATDQDNSAADDFFNSFDAEGITS